MLFKTRITEIGPEVRELAQDGVVILFATGAPPELAEVSVLHSIEILDPSMDPKAGDTINIGTLNARITALGPAAWQKVRDIGHVVVSFNGASSADRPGEICASPLDGDELVAALLVGNEISIG